MFTCSQLYFSPSEIDISYQDILLQEQKITTCIQGIKNFSIIKLSFIDRLEPHATWNKYVFRNMLRMNMMSNRRLKEGFIKKGRNFLYKKSTQAKSIIHLKSHFQSFLHARSLCVLLEIVRALF